MNSFTYNGINSADMGLKIQSKNVFSAPQYDVTFQSIPGRNGDLIVPNGRYPNMQVTYSVFLPARTTSELATKITAVKNWLYKEQNTYHPLSDTYDTVFFREAVFASQLDIEDELNRIGTFTVSFSCKPLKYANAGQTAITVSSGGTLTNPYAFDSKPLIQINGTGAGTVTFANSNGNLTLTLSAIDSFVMLDCEQMTIYKGATQKSDTVSSSGFPVLYGKSTTTVTFTGGVTSLQITPRWCSV